MQLNINTARVERYAKQLEDMHKSAIPVAVRNTLNDMAFDVKQNTLPESAADEFINRKPSFFKAKSKVQPAQGLTITNMKATVGFTPTVGNDHSVQDLEEQEFGGSIGGRAFIALKSARSGGSWERNVKSNLRMGEIEDNIVDANDATGKTDEERFIKSAIHAGKGNFIIGNRKKGKGNRMVFRITSVKRMEGGRSKKARAKNRTGNTIIKSTPVYALKKGRVVKVRATRFMKRASDRSITKMEDTFVKHAKKQLAKYR